MCGDQHGRSYDHNKQHVSTSIPLCTTRARLQCFYLRHTSLVTIPEQEPRQQPAQRRAVRIFTTFLSSQMYNASRDVWMPLGGGVCSQSQLLTWGSSLQAVQHIHVHASHMDSYLTRPRSRTCACSACASANNTILCAPYRCCCFIAPELPLCLWGLGCNDLPDKCSIACQHTAVKAYSIHRDSSFLLCVARCSPAHLGAQGGPGCSVCLVTNTDGTLTTALSMSAPETLCAQRGRGCSLQRLTHMLARITALTLHQQPARSRAFCMVITLRSASREIMATHACVPLDGVHAL